jgi:plastocyanin
MKRLPVMFTLGIVLALAACGANNPPPNTVEMGGSSFIGATTFTIKVGTTLTFMDTGDGGGSHVLYTGKNGLYEAEAGAPDALNTASGLMFNPGDTKKFTFATPGTYFITCDVHPPMQLTIIVQ